MSPLDLDPQIQSNWMPAAQLQFQRPRTDMSLTGALVGQQINKRRKPKINPEQMTDAPMDHGQALNLLGAIGGLA